MEDEVEAVEVASTASAEKLWPHKNSVPMTGNKSRFIFISSR
jgi:hypothetical protein